jgi:2',3'-cyclic-nucleotide 2'-phosphodiesterase (5'-nucleotidase family)
LVASRSSAVAPRAIAAGRATGTILHSNDLHGDFFAESVDEKLIGGVSRLSGYINKVRDEEK